MKGSRGYGGLEDVKDRSWVYTNGGLMPLHSTREPEMVAFCIVGEHELHMLIAWDFQ